jgi:hypothetical protein
MQVLHFNQSFYLSAVKDDPDLSREEGIFNFVKAHPQLHYKGKVSYQNFSEKYTSEGWASRKVWAIPKGAYHLIIETVAPLTISLIGLPIIFLLGGQGDGVRLSKRIVFGLIREIQIGFGWFACLLNDQYGLYHIQEGGFYLTCYKCWVIKNSIFVESSSGRGIIFA